MRRWLRTQLDVEWAAQLDPEARLEQANCAYQLFHDLHRPFATPFLKGFATLDEFFRFEKGHRLLHPDFDIDALRQIAEKRKSET